MKNQKEVVEPAVNLGSLIFLIFLILKLAEIGQVATWSWWWVTSPLWIPIVAVFITIILMAIITAIISMFNN